MNQSLKTLCFFNICKNLVSEFDLGFLKKMILENYWMQSITSLIWISKFTYICYRRASNILRSILAQIHTLSCQEINSVHEMMQLRREK